MMKLTNKLPKAAFAGCAEVIVVVVTTRVSNSRSFVMSLLLMLCSNWLKSDKLTNVYRNDESPLLRGDFLCQYKYVLKLSRTASHETILPINAL
jgi:hypothetical protein